MKLDPGAKLPETDEGPEAFERFRNAVKKALSVPKSAVAEERRKATKRRNRKDQPR